MKYIKGFRQETVKADSPEVFDLKMNDIFLRASASGKEPVVKFFDSMGFCACVRYYVSEAIPESLAEKYELEGNGYICSECPYFELPQDRRRKNVRCEKAKRLISADSHACDIFYLALEGQNDTVESIQ